MLDEKNKVLGKGKGKAKNGVKGCRADVIGGSYKGKTGILRDSTPKKVEVLLDGVGVRQLLKMSIR
eukprot:1892771-Ditylum_brightwellii.AAC.1